MKLFHLNSLLLKVAYINKSFIHILAQVAKIGVHIAFKAYEITSGWCYLGYSCLLFRYSYG